MIPFVPQTPEPDLDFLWVLQRTMRAGVPVPVHHHVDRPSYLPDALRTATSVYVRHDARRLPLQRPYDGPFAVLERGEKVFIINQNGSRQTVSVDRLKPANMPFPSASLSDLRPPPSPLTNLRQRRQSRSPSPDSDIAEAPLRPTTVTRSGRISRPPKRF